MEHDRFDPISLQILWSRLTSIADEMAVTLHKTSFSTVVGSANDFGTELVDASGNALVHSTTCMPTFNTCMARVVRALLRTYGEEGMHPGDVMTTNDPWLCAGHLGDIAIVSPLFYRNKLTGFAVSMAHTSDIGGTLDITGARDVYEEGLFIPLCKLYNRNEPNRELLDFIKFNVRTPGMVLGDIHAQIGINRLAEDRLERMLDEYQLESLTPLAQALQGRSERAMRDVISALPDGEYTSETISDGLDKPVRLQVKITIRGDSMLVDYTGSDPQYQRGGINVPFSMTEATTYYALSSLLIPDAPNTAGAYRPIEINAPEGCILNARPPAACMVRTRVSSYIPGMLYQALAAAVPEQAIASPGLRVAIMANGTRSWDGVIFNAWMFAGGGMGASAHGDGAKCLLFPTSASNVPVEIFENRAPIVVSEKALIPNTGGSGRHHGGQSQRMGFGLNPKQKRVVTVSLWGPDMVRYPATGILGGEAGVTGRVIFNDAVLERTDEQLIRGSVELQSGDLLVIESPGGGGYGSVEEQPVAGASHDP